MNIEDLDVIAQVLITPFTYLSVQKKLMNFLKNQVKTWGSFTKILRKYYYYNEYRHKQVAFGNIIESSTNFSLI